jgi:1-deoxy-D-xylulose-5-phosphate reductoisomerase
VLTENFKNGSIAVYGSTGSIGIQTLDVIRRHPNIFSVYALTANTNSDLLIKQALEFLPSTVIITDKGKYHEVKEALRKTHIYVQAGQEALVSLAGSKGITSVVMAISGLAALNPLLSVVKEGYPVALANKEALVVAGGLIKQVVKKTHANLLPVDSEHSAILQCIAWDDVDSVDKLILTASGGPFLGYTREQLATVTREEALRHPTWRMSEKISIDSATLMNKGFEILEAHYLFNIPLEQIEVLVHPQSIIHSMVQFVDGSVRALLSLPDMRIPILYALSWPRKTESNWEKLDFCKLPPLTFEQPDTKTFRNLELAWEAAKNGGNAPCALNAANDVAVKAFLKKEISFPKMTQVIDKTLRITSYVEQPSLEDCFQTHEEAVAIAEEVVKSLR